MTSPTAEELRAAARRREAAARAAEDAGDETAAERLWARARLDWRAAAATELAGIGRATRP